MKNLERHKNIYIYRGRFYIDFHKDKVRIRKATGIKKSSYGLKFIKDNYDLFLKDIKEAKRLYYVFENDLITKKLLDEENKQVKTTKSKPSNEYSFEALMDEFLKEKSFLKANSVKAYKTFYHIVLNFLNKANLHYIHDFERSHSVDFMAYLQENEYSCKTISNVCFFLNSIFKLALFKNLIFTNPFFVPRLKKGNDELKSIHPFCLDEVIELVKNASGELKTFLILGFFTGARIGEILALSFEDIDLINKEIKISKTLSVDGIIDTPKTLSSFRTIDMLDVVYDELVNLKYEFKNERIIKISRYQLRHLFNQLQDKLGFARRRLYDTRHSFASIMLSKGEEPMWVGCKMMGHKDLNETYRTYAKYLPKEVKSRAVFLKNINF